MLELIEAYWLLILLAILIGFVVAWFVLSGTRKTKVTRDTSAPADAPAKRNQALIDAAPAATKGTPPDSGPQPMAKEPAPAPAPVSEPTPPPPAAPPEPTGQSDSNDGDDLTRLKGVGPKLAVMLNELGVTRFAQIAAWDEAEITRIDDQLGRFKGRIQRDDWVTQAKLLSEGDTAGYEAKFGKL